MLRGSSKLGRCTQTRQSFATPSKLTGEHRQPHYRHCHPSSLYQAVLIESLEPVRVSGLFTANLTQQVGEDTELTLGGASVQVICAVAAMSSDIFVWYRT